MASIKPRFSKDGTITSFLITVSLGRDSTGRKIIQTTSYKPTSAAPTKAMKEAESFAVKFEEQVLNGGITQDERMTFEQFVDIWEKNWLPAKTMTVQENYKDVLRVRVLPYIGSMKINKIRATHIDKILNDEKAEGKAPKTIRMTFTVINSVFRYAFKKQYVHENPCLRCDDLPPIKLKKIEEMQFFTLDQAKRFLNEAMTMTYTSVHKAHTRTLKATGDQYEVPTYTETHKIPLQWRVYFTIAIYGGFRRGEMCALTWKDIDNQKKTIIINKALATTKNGQIVKSPKTEAGNREIVLPDICFTLLDQLRKEQIQTALEMGSSWKGHRNTIDEKGYKTDSFDENTVFIQFDGSPVHLSTPGHKFGEIIEMYNKTCKKEEDKLPKIRLHDLRHTSITLLLSQNTDIETVARRAGHSKASVTLDIYGHSLPEKDQTASDTLGKMFGN